MEDNDEKLQPSPSTTLQTTNAVLHASERVEHELKEVKTALEDKTRQLDHSLSILRATIESTADGILVTDEEDHVLRFNERYLQMWQIHLPEIIDMQQHKQLLKFYCKHLVDPQQFLDRMTEIYATWPTESHDLLELADGRVFERFSKIQYVEGRSIGRVWSFRDITARKRAEEALRESSERLRFMAEAMPQKIFTARADGAVDYVNQQWKDYTGLAFDRMQGWEWTKLIHPDDVDESIKRWQHSLSTGEPLQMECRFRHRNGDYRWHLTRAQAKHDAKGYISVWVGSNTDIDTIKRADEEKKQLLENERIARSDAERANRIKDEFLATLSHELRTPLNAILGWSQLILQGTMSMKDIQRGIETIERNARAQNKLIEDLLEMSSIISGKVRLDVQRLDLAAIAEVAVESVAPAAEAKGIRIRKIIDPGAGLVSGDHNRLQQIIWNLLSNAVKFTPKGGTVEVIVERVASHLEVTVRDSGAGIKPEFLIYVFDRFRQADSSLTRNHGGLGLGLAIVKQLVGLHGGTVRAESEGEGKGASFIVSLPLAPINDSRDRQSLAAPPHPALQNGYISLPGVKILVIDDEPDARELINEVLTQCEAEVITAASAMEGLEILKSQRPDVMISDIGMPEIDGYQFIREVRNLPAIHGGKTPAIALSAFAHSEDRTKAMIAGYQIHLSKPVESQELIASIGNLTGWLRKPGG
ncbi:PAS domain-containing sensor histidine kinase [Nitrosovibrio sp. Nv6]|uniref:PAS domain-containing hybrid sensor histidine kinase/response regulator n=1 Tax=Nitrosovibrio sp. Nv6 TaxID=1855340 RepID=UPI0008ACC1DD|nr:PAS domain-containing sensor histidine kinase [Nitrosovibrio sp. Nv6]SEO54686.1 PAS domain S-box-containing protein [Nitrosovibrio sp. Nv6]